MVVETVSMRFMYIARAMTFLEVHYLTREQLFGLAAQFPAVFNKIRWTAIWWSIKRKLMLLGAFSMAEQEKRDTLSTEKEEEPEAQAPGGDERVPESKAALQRLQARKGSVFASSMSKASGTVAKDAVAAGALLARSNTMPAIPSPRMTSPNSCTSTTSTATGEDLLKPRPRDEIQPDVRSQKTCSHPAVTEQANDVGSSASQGEASSFEAIMEELRKLNHKVDRMSEAFQGGQVAVQSESWVYSATKTTRGHQALYTV
eukprot:4212038-Prymnesium_polylepis.1